MSSKGPGKKVVVPPPVIKKGGTVRSNSKICFVDENKVMLKFVFEGEKFHARTPICFDTDLTLKEVLAKNELDMSLPPPTPQELFEAYFKEDIYPYIRHNIQSQIRNKKDIAKLWDLQSSILQGIYVQRARLLKKEWEQRKKNDKRKKRKSSVQTEGEQESKEDEAARKKAEKAAKKKANQQKWKEEIAMQIASGIFDEPQPKKKEDKNDDGKSHKKDKKKEKKKPPQPQPAQHAPPPQQQASSQALPANAKQGKKQKKMKKWKDKKAKPETEWPSMGTVAAAKEKEKQKQNGNKTEKPRTLSLSEQLKQSYGSQPSLVHTQTQSASPHVLSQHVQSSNNSVAGSSVSPSHRHLEQPAVTQPQTVQSHMVSNGEYVRHHSERPEQTEYVRVEREHVHERERQMEMERLRLLIRPELKFKMLIRSEHDEHVLCEMQEIRPYMQSLYDLNELVSIKIWIYFWNYFDGVNGVHSLERPDLVEYGSQTGSVEGE